MNFVSLDPFWPALCCEALFVVAYCCYVRRARLCFTTVFSGLYLGLVATGFLLLTSHTAGHIDLWSFCWPNYEQRYPLSLGNGVKPTLYILLVQLGFLVGGVAAVRVGKRGFLKSSSNPPRETAQSDFSAKHYFQLALAFFLAATAYKILRLILLDDLPVIVAVRDQVTLGKASLLSSARKNVPYWLLPSIDRQVWLVVLPLTVVMFAVVRQRIRNWKTSAALLASLAVTFFFVFAIMKRTPFMLVGIYFVAFAAICGWRRHRLLVRTGIAFAVFGLVGMTILHKVWNHRLSQQPATQTVAASSPANHSQSNALQPNDPQSRDPQAGIEQVDGHRLDGPPSDSQSSEGALPETAPADVPSKSVIVRSLMTSVAGRVLIGDSIENYFAAEHVGTTYSFVGPRFMHNYMRRVVGRKAETLAEFWYAEVSGNRGTAGSASLGMFMECFFAFGLGATVLVAFWMGALLVTLDRTILHQASWPMQPFIAALVVTIGTMSVKGFFSMFFTGGTLLLLCLAATTFVAQKIRLATAQALPVALVSDGVAGRTK